MQANTELLARPREFNGVKPGKHVLDLRVVAEDHNTTLDATPSDIRCRCVSRFFRVKSIL